MDRFHVWGLICMAVGCGFLVSALRLYLARSRFLATAQSVPGTVVEVRMRGIGRNAESVPTLEFRLPGDRVQRTESWMGSGFQRFTVGQTVPVRYDPADPGKAEVDTFAVMWGLTLLRTGYGLLFLLMGSVALILG
ncbi:MAG TPA: DUF3592 domain-containing protein [Thermoanaerobaculia bacterium]|nr:DUF3592 domain-containing protein [Thermoanaerobaculia bacterium]